VRIALIKVGALGDVVRTTSLLPGLRRAHPAMELTWVTAAGALPLVEADADVARAVAIGAPGEWRSARYDWVISLDDDRASCSLAAALAAERVSGAYSAPDGTLRYTADLEEWFGMGLLRPAGEGGLTRANEIKQTNRRSFGEILYRGLGLPPPVARPRLALAPRLCEEAAALAARLGASSGRPLVGLNTGAGGRWRFKSWGEEESAELARRLHDRDGAAVLVMGGPAEAARNGRIVAAAARPGVAAAPTDLGLQAFAALVSRCDVLVTSDSLALHLGLAAAVPVVAFFGPTSDAEIDVFGVGEKVVTPLPCRCCYLSDCDVRPHCMAGIGVERMHEAARRWLAGRPGKEGDL